MGTLPYDNSVSTVGPPQECACIKLRDWEEGNYKNKDKDDPNIGMRRGEVLIGGPGVSSGYFINPACPNEDLVKKNEEDWVEVGGQRFFRSGDVGQITPSGTLQIIDRKKDLWKGPQGEYVALSKVEAALKLCPYVEIPMVYGKTGAEWPIALCCVVPGEIKRFAQSKGLADSMAIADLCSNEVVCKEVERSCREKCKEMALVESEVPKKYCLLPPTDEGTPAWTPENELLTNTMKLKRPIIARAFEAQISATYA